MTGPSALPDTRFARAIQLAQSIAAAQAKLPRDALRAVAADALSQVADARAMEKQPARIPADIDRLCAWLLGNTEAETEPYVQSLIEDEIPKAVLFMEIFAPAARRLGEMWEEDQVSFVEVAHGVGRLHALIRVLPAERSATGPERSAVFCAAPGETHLLGVRMATELFRDRGWEIDMILHLDHRQLLAALKERETPLIGLAASGDHAVPNLIRLLTALHLEPRHRHVILCGRIAEGPPEDVATLADDVAPDIDTAFQKFEGFYAASPLHG